MKSGRTARNQTNREESHPPGRGLRLVPTARIRPIPENTSKLDNGANQTKCRLIMYIRLGGSM